MLTHFVFYIFSLILESPMETQRTTHTEPRQFTSVKTALISLTPCGARQTKRTFIHRKRYSTRHIRPSMEIRTHLSSHPFAAYKVDEFNNSIGCFFCLLHRPTHIQKQKGWSDHIWLTPGALYLCAWWVDGASSGWFDRLYSMHRKRLYAITLLCAYCVAVRRFSDCCCVLLLCSMLYG